MRELNLLIKIDSKNVENVKKINIAHKRSYVEYRFKNELYPPKVCPLFLKYSKKVSRTLGAFHSCFSSIMDEDAIVCRPRALSPLLCLAAMLKKPACILLLQLKTLWRARNCIKLLELFSMQ